MNTLMSRVTGAMVLLVLIAVSATQVRVMGQPAPNPNPVAEKWEPEYWKIADGSKCKWGKCDGSETQTRTSEDGKTEITITCVFKDHLAGKQVAYCWAAESEKCLQGLDKNLQPEALECSGQYKNDQGEYKDCSIHFPKCNPDFTYDPRLPPQDVKELPDPQ